MNNTNAHHDPRDPVPGTRLTIRIRGHLAVVDPPVYSVQALLEYRRRALAYNGGRAKWSDKIEKVWCRDKDGRLLIPAGSVPRILDYLTQASYRVVIEDLRNFADPKFTLDQERLNEQRGESVRFAQALMAWPRGLVVGNTPSDIARLVGLTCYLFHAARVVVPVATVIDVRTKAASLQPFFGGAVGRFKPGRQNSCRVVVCNYAQLFRCDPFDWEVVLLPDVQTAIGVRAVEGWAPFMNHRIYGFSAGMPALSRRTALGIEQIAGCEIYRKPYPRGELPSVRVEFGICELPRTCLPESPLERKRLAIWHNAPRNASVAAVATAFTNGDAATLWQHGLLLGEPQLAARPRNVIALVESPEHGQALAEVLPGWRFLQAVPTDTPASRSRASAHSAEDK